MTVLTPAQLQAYCNSSVVQLPNYSAISFTALQVMLATGCRPVEAFSLDQWSIFSATEMKLKPAKNNNERIILQSVLPSLFLEYFKGGSQEYGLATMSKAYLYFKKTWPTKQIYNESKQVELYCYRYNFVKQLKISGLTKEQIQSIMGWKVPEMVERYADSVIYQI